MARNRIQKEFGFEYPPNRDSIIVDTPRQSSLSAMEFQSRRWITRAPSHGRPKRISYDRFSSTELSQFSPHTRQVQTKKSAVAKMQLKRYKKLPATDRKPARSFEDALFSLGAKYLALSEEQKKRIISADTDGRAHEVVKRLHLDYFGVQGRNFRTLPTLPTSPKGTGFDTTSLEALCLDASAVNSSSVAAVENDVAITTEGIETEAVSIVFIPPPDTSEFLKICYSIGDNGNQPEPYNIHRAEKFARDINWKTWADRIYVMLLILKDVEVEIHKKNIELRRYNASPAHVYAAVQIYACGATAAEIDDAHGKLKDYRTAVEHMLLVQHVAQAREEKAVKHGSAVDVQEMALEWEQQIWKESGFACPEQRLDWTATLMQGEVWAEWCNQLGGASKGPGILLLLLVACKHEDWPLCHGDWTMWGGDLSPCQISWIAKYIETFRPEFLKAVDFLNPWAVQIYESLRLTRAQARAIRHGLKLVP